MRNSTAFEFELPSHPYFLYGNSADKLCHPRTAAYSAEQLGWCSLPALLPTILYLYTKPKTDPNPIDY